MATTESCTAKSTAGRPRCAGRVGAAGQLPDSATWTGNGRPATGSARSGSRPPSNLVAIWAQIGRLNYFSNPKKNAHCGVVQFSLFIQRAVELLTGICKRRLQKFGARFRFGVLQTRLRCPVFPVPSPPLNRVARGRHAGVVALRVHMSRHIQDARPCGSIAEAGVTGSPLRRQGRGSPS